MRQERMDYLADRRETLDAEIRNHESEARFHHRMALQKQAVLDAMTDELYDLCVSIHTPTQGATFKFDNVSTAIIADFQRSAR